jgi:hypothetical protein
VEGRANQALIKKVMIGTGSLRAFNGGNSDRHGLARGGIICLRARALLPLCPKSAWQVTANSLAPPPLCYITSCDPPQSCSQFPLPIYKHSHVSEDGYVEAHEELSIKPKLCRGNQTDNSVCGHLDPWTDHRHPAFLVHCPTNSA